MALFQASVLKKYLSQQDTDQVQKSYKKYTKYFHNPAIQENIRNSKEEQFQEGFLRGQTPLTKKDEFDWIDLFEENKTKAQNLKSQIETTENEIDKIVYELYGLSDADREIVENS